MPRDVRMPVLRRSLRALWRAEGGLGLLEFALGMPALMGLAGYGVEVSNLAVIHMRVSQYALQIADNASRIGVTNGLATYQLREGDLNDVLQGLRLFGQGAKLTTYGRVTISSLENIKQSYDTAAIQRIHWQRCIGVRGGTDDPGFDSSYGTTTTAAGSTATLTNAGTTATTGMGDTNAMVTAPVGTAVIFVEINYQYPRLFKSLFVNPQKLHYIASLMVRDKRDFTQIYNPSPAATASTCDLHNA